MTNLTRNLSFTMLVSLPILMGSTAFANDKIEQQILQDKRYPVIKQQAIKMLKKRGYQVKDIDPDSYHGKPALDIEARKNRQEYDITLAYPNLTLLKEKLDD